MLFDLPPLAKGEILPGLTSEEVLKRAVKCARGNQRGWHPRWVAVMEVFMLGSTYSTMLCKWADLDPAEKVRR